MLFSDWESEPPRPKIIDHKLEYIEFAVRPSDHSDSDLGQDQGFETAGFLSAMFSRYYRHTVDSSIEDFAPERLSELFVQENTHKDGLRLRYLQVHPTHEPVDPVTAALNEIYGDEPSELDPGLRQLQSVALNSEPW